MTGKVIVYTRPDGGAAVCVPAVNCRRPTETEDQWLVRVIVRSIPPDAGDVRIMSVDQVPTDRTFRNAWSFKDGQIAVDMTTARELHRNRLRRARKKLFREADAEMSRAHNDPARQVEIEARRQALRDAPAHPDIEAASTPAELAAVWPLPTDNPVLRDIPPPLAGSGSKGRAPSDLLEKADEAPKPVPGPEPVLSELGPSPPFAIGPTLSPDEPRPPDAAENGLSDSQRRSAAKSVVLRAVVEAARNANADQIRYEMALQAKNGRVLSMAQFEEEARISGVTVAVLADQIVAQRLALERRMSHVYTIQARALADIDRATGDAIDTITASAVSEIT